MTKNIIITGGAGFIGYHLSKNLLKKNFTENLYIRADYDYIPNVDYSNGALDEDDLSLISGSIQYHF